MKDSDKPRTRRRRLIRNLLSNPNQFPENLDVDRFVAEVEARFSAASRGWKAGGLMSEEPFLSRITEELRKRSKNCDVGIHRPMKMESSYYLLHRKENDQSDKFGADLAITLRVGAQWTKTAIFQLKKCANYKLSLDRTDLKGALEPKKIAERSFILAVDENRLGIRIEKTRVIQNKLDQTGKNSLTCDVSDWRGLTEWLVEWLACHLAPKSEPDDNNPVEAILEAYCQDNIESDDFGSAVEKNPDQRFPPPRVWQIFRLYSPES